MNVSRNVQFVSFLSSIPGKACPSLGGLRGGPVPPGPPNPPLKWRWIEGMGRRLERIGSRMEKIGRRMERNGRRMEKTGRRIERIGRRMEQIGLGGWSYRKEDGGIRRRMERIGKISMLY